MSTVRAFHVFLMQEETIRISMRRGKNKKDRGQSIVKICSMCPKGGQPFIPTAYCSSKGSLANDSHGKYRPMAGSCATVSASRRSNGLNNSYGWPTRQEGRMMKVGEDGDFFQRQNHGASQEIGGENRRAGWNNHFGPRVPYHGTLRKLPGGNALLFCRTD